MDTLHAFLKRLGGLHDAIVVGIIVKPELKTIELHVDDIYSNFQGMPQYPGAKAGVIAFEGVETLKVELDMQEKHLNIDEFVVSDDNSNNKKRASISFWPSGKIALTYMSSRFPDYPP